MFVVRNLTLVFGDQVLFNDAGCSIQAGDKIGVVGRNGAGKSTLLHILSGHVEPDEGNITVDTKKRVAYVPQEATLTTANTVFDEAFSAFSEYVSLSQRAAQIEDEVTRGTADSDTVEEYAHLHEQLAHYDAGALERQTQYVLRGLGFTDASFSQPVNTLSVGWQMRVLLARQLLQPADFYLFDEPTNHLDLPTKAWFLQFLQNMQAGYLLISHARYFLDHACDRILEIERGDITLYTGSFTTYLEKKEEARQQRIHTRKQQEKEIARKRETIARFKAKPNKAKMAKSMERELERMELIEPEPPLPTVSFKFPPIVRPGKIVLHVENVAHAFGDTKLFDHVSLELRRGQKAALVAPNGVGKTTLFNLLTGHLPMQQGSVTFGHNVTTAYFEQDQVRALDHTNTIWQEIRDSTDNISESKMRTFLGAFLFSGDTIHRSISALSGGEKNRVAMVKTLLQQANLLFLDEPTNHLDIYAKDVLLQAVQQYEGSVLYISHDREFIEKTADVVFELTPEGVIAHHGGYSAYADARMRYASQAQDAQPTASMATAGGTEQKQSTQSGKKKKDVRKRISALEKRIEQLEQQYKTCTTKLNTLSYDDPQYHEYLQEIERVQNELSECESEWESLHE